MPVSSAELYTNIGVSLQPGMDPAHVCPGRDQIRMNISSNKRVSTIFTSAIMVVFYEIDDLLLKRNSK